MTSPDVARCCSTARWRVEESAWKNFQPDLADEIIALLATPIVVSAEPVEPPPEPAEPEYPSPLEPCCAKNLLGSPPVVRFRHSGRYR